MLTNSEVRDGFRRLENYARNKQRQGRTFPWVHDPLGRVAKIIIGLLGDEKVAQGNVIRRDFAACGLTEGYLWDRFVALLPWFPEYYEAVRGEPLSPNVLYNRFHKMVYKNGAPGEGGMPCYSPEHYMCCRLLVPHVGAVKSLFRRNRSISMDEALAAGAKSEEEKRRPLLTPSGLQNELSRLLEGAEFGALSLRVPSDWRAHEQGDTVVFTRR